MSRVRIPVPHISTANEPARPSGQRAVQAVETKLTVDALPLVRKLPPVKAVRVRKFKKDNYR